MEGETCEETDAARKVAFAIYDQDDFDAHKLPNLSFQAASEPTRRESGRETQRE